MEEISSGEGSDMDDLEKEIAEESGEILSEPTAQRDALDNDESVPIDPIIKEFGDDGGVINVLKGKDDTFFFVQAANEVVVDQSYFNLLGHAFQGVTIHPPRFVDGVEVESDPNDPNTIYCELYLPQIKINEGDENLLEFAKRGALALRDLFFPPNAPSDDINLNAEIQTEPVVKGQEVAAQDGHTFKEQIVLKLDSSIEKAIKELSTDKKSETEKKKDKSKKEQDLADLVFKDVDVFVPNRPKVTLTLSEPIVPAVLGLLKKDRRLTPSSWRKIREETYNLSDEQRKALSPLSSLTGNDEEETIVKGLAPPLVKALSTLIEKNVDYHLPTMKMFDILWRANSGNKSDYATPVKDLAEAQAIIDSLLETIQHQMMSHNLLTYQLKLQIGNVYSGHAKDRLTSKVMLNQVQDNLDHNPDRGVLGHMTKTVANLAKTRKNLARGGIMLSGKRSEQEVSLTADRQPKRQKMFHLSMKNKDAFFDQNKSIGDNNGYQPGYQPQAGRGRGQNSGQARPRGGFQFGARGNPKRGGGNPRGNGGGRGRGSSGSFRGGRGGQRSGDHRK